MPEDVKPVQVTVIDVGATKQLTPGLCATVGPQPNLLLNLVSPFVAILVRAGHLYVTTMVSIIGAGMTTDVLPVSDFQQLFMLAAKLAVAGAAFGVLKDTVTILGKLEGRWPLISGGV